MTTMSESHVRLLCLSLLFLCCVTCVSPSSSFTIKYVGLVPCRPHQIQAFTEFKNEFDTRNCNHSDHVSNGVWCDSSTGAIAKLQLRACLSGILKPNSSLFGFHQLRYLVLFNNSFSSSSLPSEVGNLNKLEVLGLYSNGFLGQLPSSLSNLSMLSYLELSHNEFTGSFPLVQNLSKLSFLDLSNNHFSGNLHPSNGLFELNNLRYLDLSYNNFSSSIPSEFGKLKTLEVVCLSSNGFVGQVPPTFTNLTSLTKLQLDQNKFTGSIPLVHNLTKLSILGLARNHFVGTLPSYLLTLPSLSILDLRENNLAGCIEVPNSSTSSRLENMYLGLNHFEGDILEPISKLTSLKELDLAFLNTSYPIDLNIFSSLKYLVYLHLPGNSISPASLSSDSYYPSTLESLYLSNCGINEFPKILKSLEKLEYVDLSNNRIKGKIPEWLWSSPRLTLVNIADNLFNGFQGSTEVLLNSSVQMLFLDSNKFEGALPNLPLPLNLFGASKNSFTGEIPLSICNRSSLLVLDLSYNNFTGPIPQCLSSLAIVNLRKNNLEGNIPDTFRVGSPLWTLDIGFNQLTGKLPRSLVNCSYLEFLSVDNNNIKDTFPFWIKSLPNLQVLTLRSNKFYGSVSPPDQGPLGIPKLRILEIADNKISGNFSSTYFMNWEASSLTINEELYTEYQETSFGSTGYSYGDYIDLQYKGLSMEAQKLLTSYRAIDFSGNRLEGQIPESIGLLKALIALNLSNNAFTGHIPLSVANLKELESLDMSRNQLSGTIPNGLGGLSFLEFINVSHNRLTGAIPQGPQIMGQPESSFEGNAGLCGLPLEETCFGSHTPPTQQPKEENEEEEQVLSWKAVAIGYGSGVLVGLAVAQLIVSYKPEWLAKIMCLNKRRNR